MIQEPTMSMASGFHKVSTNPSVIVSLSIAQLTANAGTLDRRQAPCLREFRKDGLISMNEP